MGGQGMTMLAGTMRASPVDLLKLCLSLIVHETLPPWRWDSQKQDDVCPLNYSNNTDTICVNRSTATTCTPGMSRPLDKLFASSALIQTGKPCLSSSAPWKRRRIQVLILSPSFWPITWPVPSNANSTLLMPGCCSVKSPSSQVHTEQVIENYSKMCYWSLI